MKQKFYGKIIGIVSALAVLSSVSASAAVIDTFDFETDSLTIKVEGSMGKEFANNIVSLAVFKEGADLSALSGTEGILNWYEQVRADEKGEYSFSYTMNGESGTRYVASVTVFGSEDADSRLFTYFDSTEAERIIDDVAEAIKNNDPAIIRDRIIENEDRALYLQLDRALYDALTKDESRLGVCAGIMKQNPKTASGFSKALAECSKVWALNELAESGVDEYTDYFNEIKSENAKSADELFDEFSEGDKAELADSLMKTKFYTYDELIKFYNKEVITKALNDAVMWGDAYDVLETAKDVLKIDFDKYNKLKNKEAVMRKFLKVDYDQLETIKADFDQWVDEAKKSENSGSSSGSGGSGGSWGGSKNESYFIEPGITQTEKSAFSDISDVAWAKTAIERLASSGILKGDGNGRFRPQDFVTREQFASIIVRAFDLSGADENCDFADVEKGRWSYAEICKAYSAGIIKGAEGVFMPEENITRQDAAVMLYRLTGVLGKNLSGGKCDFVDEALISDYAKEAVQVLSEASVIMGSDGKFLPLDKMTRAQAAVLVYRLLNL